MTTTVETKEKRETHTPGDWHVQHLSLPHSRKLPYLIINDDVHSVARVCQEQDARLIAAAPEMYEALNNLVADWERCIGTIPHNHEAREILAKVEGETAMKIGNDSQLPLTALKGALLTNEHGAEFRIHGFFVELGDVTKVMVSIKGYDEEGEPTEGTVGVYLDSIKSWKIQLQGGME